jgi:hypothetical protein
MSDLPLRSCLGPLLTLAVALMTGVVLALEALSLVV